MKSSRGEALSGPLHALLQSIDLVLAGLDECSDVKLTGGRDGGIFGLHWNVSDILGLLAFPVCRGYGCSFALFACRLGWCRRHDIKPKRLSRPVQQKFSHSDEIVLANKAVGEFTRRRAGATRVTLQLHALYSRLCSFRFASRSPGGFTQAVMSRESGFYA